MCMLERDGFEVRAQGTLNMGGSFLQEAAWTNATGRAQFQDELYRFHLRI